MAKLKPIIRRKKKVEVVVPEDFGTRGAPLNTAHPFYFGFLAAAGAIISITLLRAFASISQVFILILISLFFAAGLNPSVLFFQRRGLKRGAAVSAVVVSVLVFLTLFIWIAIPPIVDQINMLIKNGVPENKLIIGGAFYGRFFKINEGNKVDLYQPCKFSHGFSFKNINDSLSKEKGFEIKWDSIAQAPYAINEKRRLQATYDDKKSIRLKTQYAKTKHLGGIMFWQLLDDNYKDGLLYEINHSKE